MIEIAHMTLWRYTGRGNEGALGREPITDDGSQYLTRMIVDARKGDKATRDKLFTFVYEELRRIAARRRGVGKSGHTMQPTVLANEAYLFLEKRFPLPPADEPDNRATFFHTVALAMRAILKDYRRKKNAKKRGGGEIPAVLESDVEEDRGGDFDAVDLLALDEAMDRLEARNDRWFGVVMHRYYAGRSMPEIAGYMGLSPETVKKDWKLARAWLLRELDREGPS